MLKGIDPLLSGELLNVLDTMGHADQLALVDRNFPAASSGRPVIHLGEVGVVRALEAILSVFPLDSFVERPLERMEVSDDASIVTPNQSAVLISQLAVQQADSFIRTGETGADEKQSIDCVVINKDNADKYTLFGLED